MVQFGNHKGMAGRIDNLLTVNVNVNLYRGRIAETLASEFGKSTEHAIGKIDAHVQYLKRVHGLEIERKKDPRGNVFYCYTGNALNVSASVTVNVSARNQALINEMFPPEVEETTSLADTLAETARRNQALIDSMEIANEWDEPANDTITVFDATSPTKTRKIQKRR